MLTQNQIMNNKIHNLSPSTLQKINDIVLKLKDAMERYQTASQRVNKYILPKASKSKSISVQTDPNVPTVSAITFNPVVLSPTNTPVPPIEIVPLPNPDVTSIPSLPSVPSTPYAPVLPGFLSNASDGSNISNQSSMPSITPLPGFNALPSVGSLSSNIHTR